jgi:hypothetical protein
MNKLDFYLSDDPREKSLRDAVYRALRTTAPALAIGGDTGSLPMLTA